MNWRFVWTTAIVCLLGFGYPAALWYLGASQSVGQHEHRVNQGPTQNESPDNNSANSTETPDDEIGPTQSGGSETKDSPMMLWFVGLTAVATIALALFNFQLVRLTDEMKQATAEAAKATTLALTAERPYLFVEDRHLHYTGAVGFAQMIDPRMPPTLMHIVFAYKLHNFGKGVAVVNSIHTRIVLCTGPLIPYGVMTGFMPTAAKDRWHRPKNRIIGPDKREDQWAEGLDVPLHAWEEIINLNLAMIVVGLVRYSDVFGRSYSTKFAYLYEVPLRHDPPQANDPEGILWPLSDRHNRFT
jgi:hypothetical protein